VPAPQGACTSQLALRCAPIATNVSSSQAEQVRATVLLSSEIFSPAAHLVCTSHWLAPPAENEFSGQAVLVALPLQ
jgi:hypothetical protein